HHLRNGFLNLDILHGSTDGPFPSLVLFHRQAPDTSEETVDAFHSRHGPWLGLLERAHEHLITAEAIRTVGGDDEVGIHHVAARLRHLLAVLAENEALIYQPLKRLGRGDMTKVEQDLMPNAGVEQVQHGVLGTADVEIDTAGLAATHP